MPAPDTLITVPPPSLQRTAQPVPNPYNVAAPAPPSRGQGVPRNTRN